MTYRCGLATFCYCSCCWWCCFRDCFFFFKQKTAYEMRISDWSSDVCSSDLSNFLYRSSGWIRLARSTLRLGRCQVCGPDRGGEPVGGKIGRASCRERVCQYV